MNNKFILVRGIEEKEAKAVIEFKYQDSNYLIYYTDESANQVQIFVSKLTNDNKIEATDPILKNRLNSLVYSIVVKLISEANSANPSNLINNLEIKEEIKLENKNIDLDKQEYLPTSSVAITTKEIVLKATELFKNYIKEEIQKPIWEETKTTSVEVIEPKVAINNFENNIPTSSLDNQKSQESVNIEMPKEAIENDDQIISNPTVQVPIEPVSSSENINKPISITENSSIETSTEPQQSINPQMSILNNDPNLAAVLANPQNQFTVSQNSNNMNGPVVQPNTLKMKKAGFANSKYIILGTVCLVLAVVVVIVAIILIKNK